MVTVDQRYESTISPNGIITLNSAWVNDETVERFAYKRIYGRIEACPLMFSDTIVRQIDPGFPNNREFISGEYIEKKVNEGYPWYHKHAEYVYCCSSYDGHETVTVADIAKDTDIRRFDKVYFGPNVTEPDNMLGMHKGKQLYKMRVDDIICVVRDGELLVQGSWCLIEPDMETWEEITTKAGIIMKPNPEARYLKGTIRHMQYREDISEGDHIMYVPGADWQLKIEGKEYYVIPTYDILCKIEYDKGETLGRRLTTALH